ncbi:carboxylate--amine ligase [Alloscardovia venturai]|uniref:Carboxylate--amine ligase n=1 Tax=Alloscardovia venturai TaxID=1769421 RepID=A0ABW2Y4F4_9BIFI
MARAFHSTYGKKVSAFAHQQLAPTRFSKIVHVTTIPHFDEPDTFARTLISYAQQSKTTAPDKKLLLVPCGDLYARLIAETREQIKEYYLFTGVDAEMEKRLSTKNTFYELCAQYDIPHPLTYVLSRAQYKNGENIELPFDFPIALKPANSVEYLDIHFEGREKAYIIETHERMMDIISRIYDAGYTSEIIIQDFIPGDDSRMRVLNAYVDQNSHVRMMMLGHPLLEDPSPVAKGNYSVIIPDYNDEVFAHVKKFLEAIHYRGFANFDMKYDERDGQYKLFEINLRQGRSSFFVTLNGANLAQYLTEDLVFNKPFDPETDHVTYVHGEKVWMEIPRSIFSTYVADNDYKTQAENMISVGNWGTTLWYDKDKNPLRWLLIRRIYSLYKKSYAQYFTAKDQL